MSFELRTEIDVAAPASRVWAILTDFARYAEWNPFVERIEGRLDVGTALKVRLRPPGSRAMTIAPRVSIVDAGRAFAWRRKLLTNALFVGEHRFEVVPVDDQHVRFVHAEQFSGLLVPPLKKMLNTGARAGFEAMNRALKERAERPTS